LPNKKRHNAAVERPPAFLIFRRYADGRSAPTACYIARQEPFTCRKARTHSRQTQLSRS
jgi:hypothetical protein